MGEEGEETVEINAPLIIHYPHSLARTHARTQENTLQLAADAKTTTPPLATQHINFLQKVCDKTQGCAGRLLCCVSSLSRIRARARAPWRGQKELHVCAYWSRALVSWRENHGDNKQMITITTMRTDGRRTMLKWETKHPQYTIAWIVHRRCERARRWWRPVRVRSNSQQHTIEQQLYTTTTTTMMHISSQRQWRRWCYV